MSQALKLTLVHGFVTCANYLIFVYIFYSGEILESYLLLISVFEYGFLSVLLYSLGLCSLGLLSRRFDTNN